MKLQTMCAGLVLALAACQSADVQSASDGAEASALMATLSGEACPDVGEKAYFF